MRLKNYKSNLYVLRRNCSRSKISIQNVFNCFIFLWFSQLVHQTFLLQHETRQNTTKKSSEINNIGIIAPDNHRVKETTNTKFSYNEHERFADELKGKNPQIKILYTVKFHISVYRFVTSWFYILQRFYIFSIEMHSSDVSLVLQSISVNVLKTSIFVITAASLFLTKKIWYLWCVARFGTICSI